MLWAAGHWTRTWCFFELFFQNVFRWCSCWMCIAIVFLLAIIKAVFIKTLSDRWFALRSVLILCCIVIKNSWQACKTNSNISQHFGIAPNVQLELKKVTLKGGADLCMEVFYFSSFFFCVCGLAGFYNSPKFQFTEIMLFILFCCFIINVVYIYFEAICVNNDSICRHFGLL